VGRSPAGARAAAAHSGALAGDQRVFRSLVAEAGAVWADDVHDLLELSKTIATRRTATPRPTSAQGLAIMTCSGGDSAQGADEAHALGLELPALAPRTQARLAELVRALGEDPAIGQVLVFYDQPHGMTGAPAESWRAVREGVMLGASLSPVPVMVSSTLPELLDDAAAAEFAAAGVPAAA